MHGGQEFHEAPVRCRTGAMSSMTPECAHAQGPGVQSSHGVLMHRGQKFNDAPVRSGTGATNSMRPQCADAKGIEVQ